MYLCVVVEVETAEIGEGHSGRGCFAYTRCGGHVFGRGHRFGLCLVVRWLQGTTACELRRDGSQAAEAAAAACLQAGDAAARGSYGVHLRLSVLKICLLPLLVSTQGLSPLMPFRCKSEANGRVMKKWSQVIIRAKP